MAKHMQPQMTKKMLGWSVDTVDSGTSFIPGYVVAVPDYLKVGVPILRPDTDTDAVFDALAELLRDYFQGTQATEIEVVYGYFVRLSAPGYMDCTAWTYCKTFREALAEVRDLEGDDE
jgi:hypothetical protein